MVRYTLSKQERLCSLKGIESLFKEGLSLTKYPVRLIWKETDDDPQNEYPVQVMFSVSKKKYPRAVDRNRIKRLMRESYRLYKPTLYGLLPKGKHYHLAIIYTGLEMAELTVIQKSIRAALDRWSKSVPIHQPPMAEGGNHQA